MQSSRLRKIRLALIVVMAGLVLSGLTAFPILWELDLLLGGLAPGQEHGPLVNWLVTVRQGLATAYSHSPWLAYGTDWLAFAHLLLAILFVGPWRDPARNLWVIEFGLLACVLVLPLALVCGPLRGIPWFWRLIDCCFGMLAFPPLWLARRWTLEGLEQTQDLGPLQKDALEARQVDPAKDLAHLVEEGHHLPV
ncbi:MAG: hypothetical protein AB7S38_10195 [Vulcanimicrobiota bacterium]